MTVLDLFSGIGGFTLAAGRVGGRTMRLLDLFAGMGGMSLAVEHLSDAASDDKPDHRSLAFDRHQFLLCDLSEIRQAVTVWTKKHSVFKRVLSTLRFASLSLKVYHVVVGKPTDRGFLCYG